MPGSGLGWCFCSRHDHLQIHSHVIPKPLVTQDPSVPFCFDWFLDYSPVIFPQCLLRSLSAASGINTDQIARNYELRELRSPRVKPASELVGSKNTGQCYRTWFFLPFFFHMLPILLESFSDRLSRIKMQNSDWQPQTHNAFLILPLPMVRPRDGIMSHWTDLHQVPIPEESTATQVTRAKETGPGWKIKFGTLQPVLQMTSF